MGNSCIIIRSVGNHQNGNSIDAEQVGQRCVKELVSYGHSILSAHCETGGASINLMPGVHDGVVVAEITSGFDFPARCAYERYLAAAGGKSLVSGAELPGWDDLASNIKMAWAAAANPSAPRLVR